MMNYSYEQLRHAETRQADIRRAVEQERLANEARQAHHPQPGLLAKLRAAAAVNVTDSSKGECETTNPAPGKPVSRKPVEIRG
jgi:hypothetical protein